MRKFCRLFVPALATALLCACGREIVDTQHPLFIKAVQLRESGQTLEALKTFQDYAKLNPSSVKTHFQLASLDHDRGEYFDAIYHYRQCLALDPTSADNANIGKWIEAAEKDLAVALLEKHPETSPLVVDDAKAKAQAAELRDLREERATLLQLVRKLKTAQATAQATVSAAAAVDSPAVQSKAPEAKPAQAAVAAAPAAVVAPPAPAAAVVAQAAAVVAQAAALVAPPAATTVAKAPPPPPKAAATETKTPSPPKAVVYTDPADRPAESTDQPEEAAPTTPVPAAQPEKKTAEAAPAPKAKPAGRTYTVQSGDSLFTISKKVYGTGKHHQLIYNANRGLLPSPTRLKIGQTLAIPPLPGKAARPEPILDNL